MQTKKVKVCNMAMFGNNGNFQTDTLQYLCEKYPVLEENHKNSFYMFLIIEKAEGSVIMDNQIITVDKSQIIIIHPNCINQINITKDAVGKTICFTEDFFSLRYNNNVLNLFSFLNTESNIGIRISADNLCYLNSLLAFMYNEFNDKKKASKKALRSYLNILLIEIERFYNPLRNIESNNPSKEKVKKFQKLVEENFKTVKLPSDYAKTLNISTNYLNKICKKITGMTSGDLIRKHTILEAQRLLHYTNYSINEIANKLGFEHTSYFVTIFRKTTNQAPGEFRKNK